MIYWYKACFIIVTNNSPKSYRRCCQYELIYYTHNHGDILCTMKKIPANLHRDADFSILIFVLEGTFGSCWLLVNQFYLIIQILLSSFEKLRRKLIISASTGEIFVEIKHLDFVQMSSNLVSHCLLLRKRLKLRSAFSTDTTNEERAKLRSDATRVVKSLRISTNQYDFVRIGRPLILAWQPNHKMCY